MKSGVHYQKETFTDEWSRIIKGPGGSAFLCPLSYLSVRSQAVVVVSEPLSLPPGPLSPGSLSVPYVWFSPPRTWGGGVASWVLRKGALGPGYCGRGLWVLQAHRYKTTPR